MEAGYIFKRLKGQWVDADKFPHLEADLDTPCIWWPVPLLDDIPDKIEDAVAESRRLQALFNFLQINKDGIILFT